MSTISLEPLEEEKLEEFIDKAVQKHLKLTFEDMEVVRRSPAASIIRLENKIELMVNKDEFTESNTKLERRLDRLENKVESMVTKEEFREKIVKIETDVAGVKFTQKLLISLYLSILAILGAIFVKLFFLP